MTQVAKAADAPSDEANLNRGQKRRRVRSPTDAFELDDTGKKNTEKNSAEEKDEHQDIGDDETFTPSFTYGKGKAFQLHDSRYESGVVAKALLDNVILPSNHRHYVVMSGKERRLARIQFAYGLIAIDLVNEDELSKATSQLAKRETELSKVKRCLQTNENRVKTVESEVVALTIERDARKMAKEAALLAKEQLSDGLEKSKETA